MDLGDPAIAEHHQNARFIARVCTDAERARVAASGDPSRLLWSLFAAKEAAYKAVVKLGEAPGFAHRRFEVRDDAVHYGDHVLALHLDATADRVHAIASIGPGAISSAVALAGRAHPSLAARAALCAAAAAHTGCDPAELTVVREKLAGSWDGYGPPYLHRHGTSLDLDVSLSHDGRFIAYAFR